MELPENTLPLFGDCFNELTEENITVKDGKQYISSHAFKHCELLDLNETDAIYGSTFAMMIKESFRNDKNFIVAKLKCRGTDKFEFGDFNEFPNSYDLTEESELIRNQEGHLISTHFNVFSIIKLIFKKKNDEFIGRFHQTHSISAKNPLTNSRLIGEIEFYLIENPYLQIADPSERYPPNKSLDITGLKGVFMGSDFSFCQSKKMQDMILSNCLQANRDVYLRFHDYTGIDYNI